MKRSELLKVHRCGFCGHYRPEGKAGWCTAPLPFWVRATQAQELPAHTNRVHPESGKDCKAWTN